eukprot:scaffold92898_cov16-Prasinocladus_malaysianus.AAC.1
MDAYSAAAAVPERSGLSGPQLGHQYSFRSQRRSSWTEDLPAHSLVERVVDVDNLGEHSGWVEEGEAFSEWALLNARHLAQDSVIAGERCLLPHMLRAARHVCMKQALQPVMVSFVAFVNKNEATLAIGVRSLFAVW